MLFQPILEGDKLRPWTDKQFADVHVASKQKHCDSDFSLPGSEATQNLTIPLTRRLMKEKESSEKPARDMWGEGGPVKPLKLCVLKNNSLTHELRVLIHFIYFIYLVKTVCILWRVDQRSRESEDCCTGKG